MSFIKKYFSGLSKNTALLACSSLFSDISTEMLYPVLPIFLMQTLGASGSIVGLVEGIAQATQNIVQGFSGWLSDKMQKRKSIALIGYFLSAVAKPVIGIATGWPGVLGGRFLDRLGAGWRSAPRDALIAASVEERYRGKAFGLEGFGDNLGACLGPLLTVFLLAFFITDIRYIFYLAIIPGVLSFVLVASVKEERVPVEATAKLDFHIRQFPRAYWKYLLASGIFCIGNSSNAFLILKMQAVGVSLQHMFLIYAAFNLIAALISYPAGFLSDRFGRKYILFAAFSIFAITYLGFALTDNVMLLALLFMLYGLYHGIFRAVGKALATDFVPPHLRASGIGWYNAAVGLLQLVASVVAGLLWDHVSHASVFFYGTIFAAIGAAALMLLVNKHPR